MKYLVLVAAAAAALVNAVPTPTDQADPSPTADCYDLQTDGYDDLKSGPILPQVLSPVGSYNGIVYDGFYVKTPNGKTGGLNAAEDSTPNVAAASLPLDIVRLGQLLIRPFGTISGGPCGCINLFGVQFGCEADDSITGLGLGAESCKVTVTGFKKDGTQVEAVTEYQPTGREDQGLQPFQLPSSSDFDGLVNVTFGVAVGEGTPVGTTLFLDDLKHSNFC